MRNNQPVNSREYEVGHDDFLISGTSRSGIITCANRAFMEVSGFSVLRLQRSTPLAA